MIYKELFANTMLTISDDNNSDICQEFSIWDRSPVFSFPDKLPPILTVCKMVRQEALPHFKQAAILGVSNGDRPHDASIVNRHVREQYLNHIKVVYLSGYAEGTISDTLLPNLEELHVYAEAYLQDWIVDDLCDHERIHVAKWMYWEVLPAGEALRTREAEDRSISYKVLFHFLLNDINWPKKVPNPCTQCDPQDRGSTSEGIEDNGFIRYTEVSGQTLRLREDIILTFVYTGMHLQLARHLSCGEEELSSQHMLLLRVPLRRVDWRHQGSNMTRSFTSPPARRRPSE